MYETTVLPQWPHMVVLEGMSLAEHENMLLWLIDTLGQPDFFKASSRWSYRSLSSHQHYEKIWVSFRTHEDAVLFALLWGR